MCLHCVLLYCWPTMHWDGIVASGFTQKYGKFSAISNIKSCPELWPLWRNETEQNYEISIILKKRHMFFHYTSLYIGISNKSNRNTLDIIHECVAECIPIKEVRVSLFINIYIMVMLYKFHLTTSTACWSLSSGIGVPIRLEAVSCRYRTAFKPSAVQSDTVHPQSRVLKGNPPYTQIKLCYHLSQSVSKNMRESK